MNRWENSKTSSANLACTSGGRSRMSLLDHCDEIHPDGNGAGFHKSLTGITPPNTGATRLRLASVQQASKIGTMAHSVRWIRLMVVKLSIACPCHQYPTNSNNEAFNGTWPRWCACTQTQLIEFQICEIFLSRFWRSLS